MAGIFLFLIFLSASIFDAALLPRFSILGACPLLSLAAVICYGASGKGKNFLWAALPAAIISIYSSAHVIWIFALYIAAYLSVRFFGNRFEKNEKLKLAVKAFLAIAIFSAGNMAILLFSRIGDEYSREFAGKMFIKSLVFIFLEFLVFAAWALAAKYIKKKIYMEYEE